MVPVLKVGWMCRPDDGLGWGVWTDGHDMDLDDLIFRLVDWRRWWTSNTRAWDTLAYPTNAMMDHQSS
jgi:hypothetical protein